MLRVILRQNTIHKPIPVFIKRAYSNHVDPHKVYSMPFKLSEEKVAQVVNLASYVNRHAFLSFFKIIKSVSMAPYYMYRQNPYIYIYIIFFFFLDILKTNAKCQ
jgi:hypothetical protein